MCSHTTQEYATSSCVFLTLTVQMTARKTYYVHNTKFNKL